MAFGSKKLMAPRRATTQLDRAGVAAAVERVCKELNAELRRQNQNSWLSKKLGYSEEEAERDHLRYLYDTSGDPIRAFLKERSSRRSPRWEAAIRTFSSDGSTVVEMQLLRIELNTKFTFADFSDALRAAL